MANKTPAAIVTGSTSGIGLAIAEALAHGGYNVMLNGLGGADAVEHTRAELALASGRQVHYSAADMSRPEEIRSMVEQAEQAFGSVDVLVNNVSQGA